MSRCPITYSECGSSKYSKKGLAKLSFKLSSLNDFPYSANEQRLEAAARASKISIQGVQPKLSVTLDIKNETFVVLDIGGEYIVKPQSHLFEELPQNEDLSMKLAKEIGIEVPFHGLIYGNDKSLSYFVKRFDREKKKKKLALEDFAQLSGKTRDTKYDSSMEQVVKVIDQYCTFPVLEKIKLFRLTLFNFLIGNEDMHLKNFSLLSRNNKVELSPAYDLINTTIALKNPQEEIALPLAGKKRNLTSKLFIDYFAIERLKLNVKVIDEVLAQFQNVQSDWKKTILKSFLSGTGKDNYLNILKTRRQILNLSN